jgi:hypothetical protein
MFVGSSDERMKILGCPPHFPNRKLKGLPNMQEHFQAGAEHVCARGSRRSAMTSLAKLIVTKILFFSCYRSARMLVTYA